MEIRKGTKHSDEIVISDIEEEDGLKEEKVTHNVETDVSCDEDNPIDTTNENDQSQHDFQ